MKTLSPLDVQIFMCTAKNCQSREMVVLNEAKSTIKSLLKSYGIEAMLVNGSYCQGACSYFKDRKEPIPEKLQGVSVWIGGELFKGYYDSDTFVDDFTAFLEPLLAS